MSAMQNNFPWLAWPETQALARIFGAGGIRFVGGCARDSLLARPVQDIDAATPFLPQRVQEMLAAHGVRALPTGIAHGTVTALIGGRHFEITTLRKDTACDGRHAEVAFTESWEEDARRRDFTVNALSVTPQGEVHDYTGGLGDLQNARLRFIGEANARVREDYLRILRYYRFSAQLEWKMDAAERAACASGAEGIDRLSGERIHHEMMKLLAAPKPGEALAAMREDGVLGHLLPGAAPPALDPLLHAESLLGLEADALTRLCRLLKEESALAWLRERWKLSGRESSRLRLLLITPRLSAQDTKTAWKARLRKMGAETFRALAALSLAATASNSEAFQAMVSLSYHWTPPVFPVSGKDLLARGVAPGPELGETLRLLEKKWEESDYALTREELLNSLA